MTDAPTEQKGGRSRRNYTMHGDSHRQRLVRERGVGAIDARRIPGRDAKSWRAFALVRKGGKTCPPDIKQKIDAGCFYLWRAASLHRR